jgi:DNA-binding NtrC family response regulator
VSGSNGHSLIGDSEPMRRLRSLIAIAAPSRLSVLIEGETGSGKELVAAAIHAQSRRTGRFVAFNVCAIGDAMFEDALFGHVRGAFTGAIGDASGLLREADGGTAFFDEVSGLAPALQAKLLRAIETREFRPVGAARDVRSDFRVVAATNESLERLVARGGFRPDLAHRLGAVRIRVPSLSERREDIPALVRHFLNAAGRSEVAASPGALKMLQSWRWTGNVRELRHLVEWAGVVADGHLDEGTLETAIALRGEPGRVEPVAFGEAEALFEALRRHGGDKELAARDLGIHLATLYRRLKRHHAWSRLERFSVDTRSAGAKSAG